MMNQIPETRAVLFTGPEEQLDRIIGMAREIGGLGVHDLPLFRRQPAEAGPYEHLPLVEREFQEKLDQSVSRALVPMIMKNCRTLEGRLRVNGVRSIRDVLSLGRMGLNHGTQIISGEQRAKLARGIQIYCRGQKLLDRPTAAEIAQFCISLDQVHGGVLSRYGQYLKERRAEIAAAGRLGWQGAIENELGGSIRAGLRVSHILTNTYSNPPKAYPDFTPASVFSPVAFEECQEQARVFAAEFTLARQQIEQGTI